MIAKQKRFLLFSAKLLSLYALWKGILYLLENNEPGLWLSFKNYAASLIVREAAWMASHLMGLTVTYNSRNLFPDGRAGIFLADHCIGITATVVFSVFILAYEGRGRDKAWFIPLGAVLIFFINSLRIAALAYIQSYYSEFFFRLAHSYVYLLITYGLIFLLIVWWVEVFAPRKISEAKISSS